MEQIFNVDGMMCHNCTGRVEKVIGAMDGVESVKADLEKKTVTVVGSVSAELLRETVEDLGFTVL